MTVHIKHISKYIQLLVWLGIDVWCMEKTRCDKTAIIIKYYHSYINNNLSGKNVIIKWEKLFKAMHYIRWIIDKNCYICYVYSVLCMYDDCILFPHNVYISIYSRTAVNCIGFWDVRRKCGNRNVSTWVFLLWNSA